MYICIAMNKQYIQNVYNNMQRTHTILKFHKYNTLHYIHYLEVTHGLHIMYNVT
jgi:hypothetical protein